MKKFSSIVALILFACGALSFTGCQNTQPSAISKVVEKEKNELRTRVQSCRLLINQDDSAVLTCSQYFHDFKKRPKLTDGRLVSEITWSIVSIKAREEFELTVTANDEKVTVIDKDFDTQPDKVYVEKIWSAICSRKTDPSPECKMAEELFRKFRTPKPSY
jgi:hypothetical protein